MFQEKDMLWVMNTKELIFERLKVCPPSHRTIFSLSCCERLLPNYKAFVSVIDPNTSIKTYHTIYSILDKLWGGLTNSRIDSDELHEYLKLIDSRFPDKQHDFLYAILARQALEVVDNTIKTLLYDSLEWTQNIVELMLTSINFYLNAVNIPVAMFFRQIEHNKSYHRWLLSCPIIIFELEQQLNDLSILETTDSLDAITVQKIRNNNFLLPIDPIKRGLITN